MARRKLQESFSFTLEDRSFRHWMRKWRHPRYQCGVCRSVSMMAATGITQQGSSKLKKKHFKPKYQKTKLFRANEPLLSVFMWGVNHTVSFRENMPSHFKVKEYCPLVFRNLRERFGIDDVDYMNSLTKSQPLAVTSPGRSGAKFYESYDRLFIIKTLQSEEVEQMHSLLKQYHPYIVECHGKTLLPQYLGMYRLTVEGAETYMVVMRNIFSSSLNVHRKYDLKGSTIDREASEKEKEKELPTLKDNDFVRDGYKLHIGQEAKDKLINTLTADVTVSIVIIYSCCSSCYYIFL
ncbi:phosphatidylinositol 5-phosphate 4-kinase type-2 beta-like [Centruroides sculpturatus]|uniref:phosphatidylinositol 5-phosphate 4-kinase type-2 beta-like n=1 Tax=Centruroides sculpturatus TaxID=218467 RepID=UPI000C6C8DCE|nr:phosphatidylinositol 5-phosphate 4-kinase type-2 beta-like [Centruroides sculpturatus]